MEKNGLFWNKLENIGRNWKTIIHKKKELALTANPFILLYYTNNFGTQKRTSPLTQATLYIPFEIIYIKPTTTFTA